jgi:hypothetical protein
MAGAQFRQAASFHEREDSLTLVMVMLQQQPSPRR